MQRLKACRLGDEPKDSDFSRSAPAPATGDHREGFLHKVATNLKALKSGARNSGDPGQDFGPQKERDVFYSGSVTGLGTSSSFARHKSPSPPPIDLCDFDTEMGSPSTSDPSEFNFELALAGFTIDDYPVLALLSSGDAYRDIGTSKVIKFIEDEPMVDATILEEATEESLDDTVSLHPSHVVITYLHIPGYERWRA